MKLAMWPVNLESFMILFQMPFAKVIDKDPSSDHNMKFMLNLSKYCPQRIQVSIFCQLGKQMVNHFKNITTELASY